MKILYFLLTVFKSIGIIMLVLLLLILLLLIIILTVPIKYKLNFDKEEEIYFYANIKWLCIVVYINGENNNVTVTGSIFGIPIKTNKNTKTTHRQLNRKSVPVKNKDKKNTQDKTKDKRKSKAIKRKPKVSIKEITKQIKSFTYKKDLLIDTIEWIKETFRSIGPDYLMMNIEFGKEDPAETGYIMAFLSALYPVYYPYATITGNYQEECFYVKIKADGSIVLVKLLYEFIKYIRKESVRRLLDTVKIRRKEKLNGRKAGK